MLLHNLLPKTGPTKSRSEPSWRRPEPSAHCP